MATISKAWGLQIWIEGGAASFTTLSGTTEEYSDVVDMETNGYEGAHVQPEVNFDAGPTDDVIIKVYGSLDGTNFDDTSLHQIVIDKGTDPNQISFIVRDTKYFRLGFQQTGATDSHDVRASYSAWRWQSA